MGNRITETGPVKFRGVRNPDLYNNLSDLAKGGDQDAATFLSAISAPKARPFSQGRDPSAYFDPQQYATKTPYATLGESKYDAPYVTGTDQAEVNEQRYENQPWYMNLINGGIKMAGTAGTTFLSSLIGLPYGAVQAGIEGRWSALWDNHITQGLSEVDKWLEDNFTNYRSQVQQNSPWYSPDNLFSTNMIADDIIKNLGFTQGAAASMMVGTGEIGLLAKSLGFVDKFPKIAKTTGNVLGALFSATGEGMIEAKQGVEERNKLQKQRFDDSILPEVNAIREEYNQINNEYSITGDYNTYMNRLNELQKKQDELNRKKEAAYQEIEETGLEMGNKILGANQVLLTLTNLLEFSRGLTKGFNNARHAAEINNKMKKPFLVGAERVSDNLADGYKITGSKKLGQTIAATKNMLTEGSEEMNQEWIQRSAGYSVDTKDINDYWKARLNPESFDEATSGFYTFGQALDRGFKESWLDVNQWQQFMIGALTGVMGTYSPTKIFNQDKTKSAFSPWRYGSWEGGAWKDVNDFNDKYEAYKQNIDELNEILATGSVPSILLGSVGRTTTEKEKEAAAEAGDKRAWEDAEDKQMIHVIQSFLRAGKLGDLRALYSRLGENLSDEDIEDVIRRTTKEEEDGDGRKMYNGTFVTEDGNRTMTPDEIREKLKTNSKALTDKLDSYLESINYISDRTHGTLTNEQEDNLAYLHNMGKSHIDKVESNMASVRKSLPKKFLLKTEETPESLAKIYASSDLAFSRDEHTKKGYVEVDTSLMNDKAFADFFQREILRGGNIRPEFAETAEEKAAREEEENQNLSKEEKKKRARERATKKWMDAIKQKERDAEEQWKTNWELLVDNFFENYKKDNNSSYGESVDAFNKVASNIEDAAYHYNKAGEFFATLDKYMKDPTLVDKDKSKEEEKIQKAEETKQAKQNFEGKTAKQMKQELADGVLDDDAFIAFASSQDPDASEEMKTAQEEAKKAQTSNQKANSLKQHILESDADENMKEAALAMVDQANLNTNDPEEFNLDTILQQGIPIEKVDPTANVDDATAFEVGTQNLLAEAYNYQVADEAAQNDIPEMSSDVADAIESEETEGKDPIVKTKPEIVAPVTSSPSKAAENPVAKNPLTDKAIDNIISATSNTTKPTNVGTWRCTTRRHGYGKSTGTYHDSLDDKNSTLYKRSKAIWEYFNATGVFDRQDDASATRTKVGDTIHFMVKNLSQEIFGKDYNELTEKEKPFALVILMMNENMEVLGDLPLAQFEKGYGNEKPGSQLAHLKALQEKVFDAFDENYKKTSNNEAVVDNKYKEGADNLNLTMGTTNKPLVSKVKQMMRGVVPYRKSEKNTLNEVAQDFPFELGVAVDENVIAKRRGDGKEHKDIVKPSVGTVGQPYLLLPTPSGETMAVPFYMVHFDAENHRNTEFYRVLNIAMSNLLANNAYQTQEQKIGYDRALDIVKGLLQIEPQDGVRTVFISGDKVTFNFQSIVDKNQKITLSVPNNIGVGNIIREALNQLTGTRINVSLQFLNDNITLGDQKINYNRLIGEIADVNLPKATTHTVGGWFTVELTTQAGIKPTKNIAPKSRVQTQPQPATQSEEAKPEAINTQSNVQSESKNKTVEQIESEMKQKKIVGRQTKDAWAAIPDDLKLKLVNDGATLQLSYNDKTVTISMNDRQGMIKALSDVNMAAKAGSLKVIEAAKPMKKSGIAIQKEKERAARKWLADNLPSLSSEERTQFVEKLSRMGKEGGKYWGSYRSGVIEIANRAPMGTVYHEAFHYVMDMVLSPEEKQQILKLAKEEYGLDNDWEAEERLANDFRRFALDENDNSIVGRLKRWFRKLMDKITRYNRISDATINQLFWKINNGELAQRSLDVESFEKNQQDVLREIRAVQSKKYAWRNLSAETKRNIKDSGLSEAAYNEMSLEEKEQIVKCRG